MSTPSISFSDAPVESVVLVDPAPVAALVALFDDGLDVVAGDPLPPLWHWVAVPRWPASGLTGPDGHPLTGGFLPDVGKSRRMFAGGTVELHAPLTVGDDVRRVERVLAVTPKSGRQGDLVLVEVATDLYAGERLAVHEVQHLIYRDPPTPQGTVAASAEPATVAPRLLAEVNGRWELSTDPTKLVRFSAATSNGHRIHYDHPYATQVEGYPGLVVHGPLMSLALAEVWRLTTAQPPSRLSHRNVAPLFCGQPAHVEVDGNALALVTGAGPRVTLAVD